MSKLDLTRATRIKGQGGEILRLRGAGFVWARPLSSFLFDTFSGKADGTDLNTHVGESGHGWSRHPAAPSTPFLMTALGRVYNSTGGGATFYQSSVLAPASDYDVSAVINHRALVNGAQNVSPGVTGRGSATVQTYYMARFIAEPNLPYRLQLFRVVNGTFTWIGPQDRTFSFLMGEDRKVGLRMAGSQISLLLDDSVQFTVTDTAITGAGRVGIRSFGNTAYTPTAGWQYSSVEARVL